VIPLLLVGFLLSGCGTANSGYLSNVGFGKDDYKKIVSSQNQLGFDLLPEVGADKDGNVFISPTSLILALSMAYNGTDGVTKEEMARVFHSEGIEASELNKANASLMSMLQSHSKHGRLQVANSIWLNQRFHFKEEFAQNNRDYFNAKVQGMDPTDKESPKMMNDWVKKATGGKIKGIVDSPMDPNFVAMLINAIYFKGDWQYPFDKELTEKRPFHLDDGTTKELPLMTLHEKLDYMENENFQAAILPYADGKMSMSVFLPKEGISLKDFERLLTADNWMKWKSEFSEKAGTVLLPKFQLEYGVILNDALKTLGMTTAFDEGANFTKMIKEKGPVWISEVKQKTFIDVNEKGTEAAAATSVGLKTSSMPAGEPFHMEVNRPFFIAITDNVTGALLFMGAVSNP
jgi:serine protease inhibitor